MARIPRNEENIKRFFLRLPQNPLASSRKLSRPGNLRKPKTKSFPNANLPIYKSYVYRFRGCVYEIPPEVLVREGYEFLVLDLDLCLRGLLDYSIPRLDILLQRLLRGRGLRMAFPKETIEWVDQCIKQGLDLVILTDNFTFQKTVTYIRIGEHYIPVVSKAHKPNKESFNAALEFIDCQDKNRKKGCIIGDSRKESMQGLEAFIDAINVRHADNPLFQLVCFFATSLRQKLYFDKIERQNPGRVIKYDKETIDGFSRPNR